MNRTNGAYAPLKFQNFCLVIEVEDRNGRGSWEGIVTETSSRRAIAQACAGLRADGFTVGKVRMCKTPDQMTEDDRWRWGVQTAHDVMAEARRRGERGRDWAMLDLY